uniref:Macrocin O-methyltransferase n=2 Tax=Calcidiscus leptoporus TaxID=127549 RepID=A0A7S0NMH8_9EUKA|mmetsp:Transcript_10042/g.23228  ORF Transcript_10042/g.23228 Transcript_10042/m.23228 type:complete len:216 (+) Transcript_10042:108-755(+)
MRGVLMTEGDRVRRVYCADTFVGSKPPQSPPLAVLFRPLFSLVSLAASVPSKRFSRWLFSKLIRLQSSFPADEANTADDAVRSFLFYLRNGNAFSPGKGVCTGNGIASVQSHFARLGLLDKQVVFLKGFFSDTLPTAPIERLSLLRLDGDLYASTRDALEHMYPKLSPGGFCIVDDYYSFQECRRAVDEYRELHHIGEEMVSIDEASVFWRRRKL